MPPLFVYLALCVTPKIFTMEKFLRIPVTGEQTQLVRATGMVLVEQANATSTVITYDSQLTVTLTHSSVGAGNETMRDFIQDSVESCLIQPWAQPVLSVTPPVAVSNIVVGILAQPTA